MSHAIKRLSSVPEVFTSEEFCRRTGMSHQAAGLYLVRLKHAGLVETAGPRTGLFFNRLKQPQIDASLRLQAAKRLYPSALVVGAACLHAAGFTTQIPHVLDVAVKSRPSIKQLDGLKIVRRPLAWYRRMAAGGLILREGQSPFVIESLAPRAALHDAREHPADQLWLPDPEDLDIPEEPEADDWQEVG
jgi:hypothetical protein